VNKFYILVLGIVTIFLGYWLGVIQMNDWSKQAQFGDMFGGLNSLFSGLALAGVVFSIFQQNKNIEQQNETLELQRRDLLTQQKMLEAQLKEMSEATAAHTMVAEQQKMQTHLLQGQMVNEENQRQAEEQRIERSSQPEFTKDSGTFINESDGFPDSIRYTIQVTKNPAKNLTATSSRDTTTVNTDRNMIRENQSFNLHIVPYLKEGADIITISYQDKNMKPQTIYFMFNTETFDLDMDSNAFMFSQATTP